MSPISIIFLSALVFAAGYCAGRIAGIRAENELRRDYLRCSKERLESAIETIRTLGDLKARVQALCKGGDQ